MKHHTIITILLLGVFACGQPFNKENTQIDTTKKKSLQKELWTAYAKQDTIFHVKRLVSSDTGLTLLSYDINTSEPEVAKQTFISSKNLADENEAVSIKSQSENFNWVPFNTAPVLFVQLQSSAFKDEMKALITRQDSESKIEDALKKKGLGKWIAGDLGPGGANMLFEVSNIDSAIVLILEELSKTGLDKNTTIGRRVNTESDNWFYEVIYPNNFSGVFVTM